MTSGGSNRLLTAQETADRLRMNKEVLYRNWRKLGLKAYRPDGKKLLFRERDIEAFIESKAA